MVYPLSSQGLSFDPTNRYTFWSGAIWDELIQNKDRNQGNLPWTSDWTLWLIDHTRAFRLDKKLQNPNDLTRCERSLLDGLRRLTAESLAKAVGASLTRAEQEAVMPDVICS